MPVVYVNYWDAVRFANFLDDGNTESGAYTLIGGNTDGYGTPSNASSVTRSAGASVWLPSENEWYKAAYYNPGTGLYSTYATQSNTAPGNIIGNGANEANYYAGNGYSVTQSGSTNYSQNYLTAVGSFTGSASYYGTYDQSGDVYNWCDTLYNSEYVMRGGSWQDGSSLSLWSDAQYSNPPFVGGDSVGFRLASIPEPSSVMLMLAGVFGMVWMRGKSFKL
jgi:formylglycine-generating enzyme required for sulfatase activity